MFRIGAGKTQERTLRIPAKEIGVEKNLSTSRAFRTDQCNPALTGDF